MVLTNKSGLPEAIVQAMVNDDYNKGAADFSVTQLLKPSRISVLEELHGAAIEEDVEDGLYRLYGKLAHNLLERANVNDIAEKRLFSKFGDYTVSGQFDTISVSDSVLSDYKFTTSWGFKSNNPPNPDWVAQLNMLLELLRRNGGDAKALQIVGLLRDWQKRDAQNYDDYPRKPIVVMPIPIWDRDQTTSFINLRISAHTMAKLKLPNCTDTEMWAKPDMWAAMKKGRKSAMKLHMTEQLAKDGAMGPGEYVEKRPGSRTRCESYCKVAPFCTQYQQYKQEKI